VGKLYLAPCSCDQGQSLLPDSIESFLLHLEALWCILTLSQIIRSEASTDVIPSLSIADHADDRNLCNVVNVRQIPWKQLD
jgi:hypothetical protein